MVFIANKKVFLTHTCFFLSIFYSYWRYPLSTQNPTALCYRIKLEALQMTFYQHHRGKKPQRKNYDKWFGIDASAQHMSAVVYLRVNRQSVKTNGNSIWRMSSQLEKCLSIVIVQSTNNCILSHKHTRKKMQMNLYRCANRNKIYVCGTVWQGGIKKKGDTTDYKCESALEKSAYAIKSTSMMKNIQNPSVCFKAKQ